MLDRESNQSTVIGNLENVPLEPSLNKTDNKNNNSRNSDSGSVSNNSTSSDNSTSSSSNSSSNDSSCADSQNRSEGLDPLGGKGGLTQGPGSVPLTPQRVKLLTALYERTGRGGKAEELYVRAVQEGLSSYYDLGEYCTCALYMCTCMIVWTIKI